MRLCAENNRLKLRERDDARRIDFLLKISGMRPAEAALFMSQSICLTRSSSTTSVMENDAAPRVIDDSQNPIVVNPKKPILGTVECTVTGAVRRMKPNELSGTLSSETLTCFMLIGPPCWSCRELINFLSPTCLNTVILTSPFQRMRNYYSLK